MSCWTCSAIFAAGGHDRSHHRHDRLEPAIEALVTPSFPSPPLRSRVAARPRGPSSICLADEPAHLGSIGGDCCARRRLGSLAAPCACLDYRRHVPSSAENERRDIGVLALGVSPRCRRVMTTRPIGMERALRRILSRLGRCCPPARPEFPPCPHHRQARDESPWRRRSPARPTFSRDANSSSLLAGKERANRTAAHRLVTSSAAG